MKSNDKGLKVLARLVSGKVEQQEFGWPQCVGFFYQPKRPGALKNVNKEVHDNEEI